MAHSERIYFVRKNSISRHCGARISSELENSNFFGQANLMLISVSRVSWFGGQTKRRITAAILSGFETTTTMMISERELVIWAPLKKIVASVGSIAELGFVAAIASNNCTVRLGYQIVDHLFIGSFFFFFSGRRKLMSDSQSADFFGKLLTGCATRGKQSKNDPRSKGR